jgi:hypothetical protein
MLQPSFPVRVQPLVAWTVFLIVFSLTAFFWLIGEPIVHSVYASFYSSLPSEAVSTADFLKFLYYAILIIIDSVFALWAFLVTVRRQPVVNPYGGGY